MAGSDRTSTHSVAILEELHGGAERFDFFQAVRLLECAHRDRPRIGRSQRAADDPVRMGQRPSLAFAPSTLSDVRPGTNGRPWRMNVNFLGLLGPNGPLPLHLTEYARQRERHAHDPTFSRFLDIFHHRMLCLFYRAWADAQPVVHYDRPETDRFGAYVASLFGLGLPELRDRDAWPDLAKLYFAGQLAGHAKSPESLRSILTGFFQLPVEINEFVGQWTEIPESCRCFLGESADSATLGRAATIGSHVWDCQQKFRITIGPMGWSDYQRLLPGGRGLARLESLVRNFIGEELAWEINLLLRSEETPAACLEQCGLLGQSTWLAPDEVGRDADDYTATGSR